MGIQGLLPMLKEIQSIFLYLRRQGSRLTSPTAPRHVKDYKGKTIGVDA